jgi:hypothetical protein
MGRLSSFEVGPHHLDQLGRAPGVPPPFKAFGNAQSRVASRHRGSTDRSQIQVHMRLSARCAGHTLMGRLSSFEVGPHHLDQLGRAPGALGVRPRGGTA